MLKYVIFICSLASNQLEDSSGTILADMLKSGISLKEIRSEINLFVTGYGKRAHLA